MQEVDRKEPELSHAINKIEGTASSIMEAVNKIDSIMISLRGNIPEPGKNEAPTAERASGYIARLRDCNADINVQLDALHNKLSELQELL